MREDPNHDLQRITLSLAVHYEVQAVSIAFLPIGYDFTSAVYDVTASDGTHYFLKVRSGEIAESSLLVPRALVERGIPNIPSPLPTRSGALWCPLDDAEAETVLILYPFIRGQSAMDIGLSDEQWRTFGATLRAVHDSGLHERFRDQVPSETFALPAAALVRRMIAMPESVRIASPAAEAFARFWDGRGQQIEEMLTHVETMGQQLQTQTFTDVLCHADIHAANILVGDDDRIWLVDWDGPKIAPRERDLLFVVGSRIAGTVEPREEDLFFEGYGPTTIDPLALSYYRYERIIEDLGEIARQVLLDDTSSDEAREADAALAISFFDPGGDIDRAESVARTRWPSGGD
jgi:spectinomycin phosphotransferase